MLILLLVSLPVGLYLTKLVQDIRPRADITSNANFRLSASDDNPDKGETFTVNATIDLESSGLRVSGVDFRILYDKNLLEPNPTVEPAVGEDQPFTDTLVTEVDKPYNSQFNYLRVVLVSRRSTPELIGGSDIPLANISFKAKNTDGAAIIKYPQENQDANGVDIMQVSGIDLGEEEPTPTEAEEPTPTEGGPTLTPSPTEAPEPTDPPEVKNGLVGWWKMNERTGGNVKDDKGNHNGTAQGTAIADGLGGGKARVFDGINDYVKVPISNALKPAKVSVSVWFKGTARDGYLFTTAKSQTEYKGYSLRFATTQYTAAFIIKVPGTALSTKLAQINDTSIFDGNWHHIVGTYDNNSVKLYIDGQLKDTEAAPDSTIEYGTSDLYMGSVGGNKRFFKGSIDAVRFYNRALTQADVTKLFQIKR